jgi:hypothetical protein
MPLTANRDVHHYVEQSLRTLPVKASAAVYKGAFVGLTAGAARGLVAGDPFAGIAFEQETGGSADGAERVRVYTSGDFAHALTGALAADIGRPVFASADNVLTFSGNGNSYVGVVQDVPAADSIILRIDPFRTLVKTITHAVENLAAGADIAARAIHTFANAAWITAVRVVNQASAAAGIDASNTTVVTVAYVGGDDVATATFNNVLAFPLANVAYNMTLSAATKSAAGNVLGLAVTNGAAADPGPFLVEVDYV